VTATNSYNAPSPNLIRIFNGSGGFPASRQLDDATCEISRTAGASGSSDGYDATWGGSHRVIAQRIPTISDVCNAP
jgi:hypothetical protein